MKKVFLVAILAFVANVTLAQQNILLNLNKGETKQQTVEADIKISQDYMGMKMDINMDMDVAASFNVLETKGEAIKFDVQYDKMEMTMKMMDMDVVMSSEIEDDTNPANKMFKAFTENSFQVLVSNRGETKAVIGFDKVFDAMINGAGLDEKEKAIMEKELRNSVNEDSFTQSFNFNYLPSKAVKVGDTWNRVDTQKSSNIEMTTNSTYTLKELTEEFAIIDITGTLATDKGAINSMQGMKVSYDMGGKMNGIYKVDLKTGWILDATLNQDVSGAVKMIDQGTEMPMDIKSTIKIK